MISFRPLALHLLSHVFWVIRLGLQLFLEFLLEVIGDSCSLRYHESVRAAEDLVRTEPYGRLLTARAVYGHAGFPGPDARQHGILLAFLPSLSESPDHYCLDTRTYIRKRNLL